MSDKQEEKKEASGVFIDVNALFGDANVDEATLLEMAKAGVLYGHKKNRRNPQFRYQNRATQIKHSNLLQKIFCSPDRTSLYGILSSRSR